MGAHQLHVALPRIGLEVDVGQEAMYWLTLLLPNSLELSCPCLGGLLGDTAGNDVVEDLPLREVDYLRAEAAVEHLGHVLGEALEEAVGAVPEPLLVFSELVVEKVVVLLVDGLATECEGRPLDTFCLGADLTS